MHLFSQSRGKLRFDAAIDAFVPGEGVQAERSAGAANGTYALGDCLEEGWAAGAAAAGLASARTFAASATRTGFRPVRILPGCEARRRGRAFVDFQNDVTAKDIELAVREGFESIEHVKRYTTTGMATDQGKTSNMTALGLVAEALRKPVPEVGTTTFRPPYTPVTFGALAGAARGTLFDPVRTTPIARLGRRARRGVRGRGPVEARPLLPAGRRGHARRRGARMPGRARAASACFDASTLGKIEVVGPDAAEFLNRIYTNAFTRLEPGRCRYGLMLREDGYILDDGVVARLAGDRFHVTTTTGGAARVLQHMEDYLQTEWPQLKVYLTSITEQYRGDRAAGAAERARSSRRWSRASTSPSAAFPHMAVRTGAICGVPVPPVPRLLHGRARLRDQRAGRLRARGVGGAVRARKSLRHHALRHRGHARAARREGLHHRRPGDGRHGDARRCRAGAAGGKAKGDFVGKRSLRRPDLVAPRRKQLVGLLTEDARTVLDEGAQLVADPAQPMPMRMLGHVTSSYWSANCGRSIALALLESGRSMMGRRLHATTPDGFAEVRVCAPVFFDAKGERVHG